MNDLAPRVRDLKPERRPQVRASISFPPDLYKTLEKLAQLKKVSLAWVVREASEEYVLKQLKPGRKAGHL